MNNNKSTTLSDRDTQLENIPMLQLNDGQRMPQLGLGTYDVLTKKKH